jgi:hypothetical protein
MSEMNFNKKEIEVCYSFFLKKIVKKRYKESLEVIDIII